MKTRLWGDFLNYNILDDVSQATEEIQNQLSAAEKWFNGFLEWGVAFLPKLIAAILVLIFGLLLAKLVKKIIKHTMKKGKVDPTVQSFLGSIINIAIKILVIVCALGTLGLDMTSIITTLGAATVAVGLALKDSMANLASGVLIIINKPFKLGDYLETEGLQGTVIKIEMMYTTLRSFDGKEILLPNSRITANNVINYNVLGERRVDLIFSISYDDDIAKAKQVIAEVLNKETLVLENPEPPFIGVNNHSESCIEIIAKFWCKPDDYWPLYHSVQEDVKIAFDANGITIPYNKLDVTIMSEKEV